jgi:hypothetical protein
MTSETTLGTDTPATTPAAASMPTAPERLAEPGAVPAVRRRASCDYWDLATCTWVRCPDA